MQIKDKSKVLKGNITGKTGEEIGEMAPLFTEVRL